MQLSPPPSFPLNHRQADLPSPPCFCVPLSAII